jgi:hypothetical protein
VLLLLANLQAQTTAAVVVVVLQLTRGAKQSPHAHAERAKNTGQMALLLQPGVMRSGERAGQQYVCVWAARTMPLCTGVLGVKARQTPIQKKVRCGESERGQHPERNIQFQQTCVQSHTLCFFQTWATLGRAHPLARAVPRPRRQAVRGPHTIAHTHTRNGAPALHSAAAQQHALHPQGQAPPAPAVRAQPQRTCHAPSGVAHARRGCSSGVGGHAAAASHRSPSAHRRGRACIRVGLHPR